MTRVTEAPAAPSSRAMSRTGRRVALAPWVLLGGSALGAACVPTPGIIGSLEEYGSDGGADASTYDAAEASAPDAGRGPWYYVALAGNGSPGFSGDGGPATSAQLGPQVSGVARDARGNLYIADGDNQRIRKVDPTGVITTIAGTGTAGNSGNGGPAASAAVNAPSGMAVDVAGNLYFSEYNNQDIRVIDTSGVIEQWVALGGQPTSICMDAAGNLYVAMPYLNQIWRYDVWKTRTVVAGDGSVGYRGDGAPAVKAQLDNPNGVWASRGNVYIVDAGNEAIRRVDASGTITTIAGGNGSGYTGDEGPATHAQIHPFYGVAADAQGNVYFSQFPDGRIREVDTAGIIHTIAGSGGKDYSAGPGLALDLGLNGPGYMWMDARGALYVSADGNSAIYELY